MNIKYQLLKHHKSVQLKNTNYSNEFKDVNETSGILLRLIQRADSVLHGYKILVYPFSTGQRSINDFHVLKLGHCDVAKGICVQSLTSTLKRLGALSIVSANYVLTTFQN